MKRRMIYGLVLGFSVMVGWLGAELWVASGRAPRGERLQRCEQSPQWKDGAFRNTEHTPQLTGNKGFVAAMWDFLFKKVEGLRPSVSVPTEKSDLLHLDRREELVVWLGHSSVFIQTGGKRFLFDPILTNKIPVWLFMRPFQGADVYTPEDIPDVDYLVITHDHWDHLDYKTVKSLRNRVAHVVCGLGIGEDFEYWGYPVEKIHEMDWDDSLRIDDNMTLRCLPSRHFSGRLLARNKALWASYLIDGERRVFVTGDGGYDARFRKIGTQYPGIDLAIMENGQYDSDWHYIHTMPSQLPKEIEEIGAKRVMTYHNSKYALAKHDWRQPLDSIYANAQGQPWQLLTPKIGQQVRLKEQQVFDKWW